MAASAPPPPFEETINLPEYVPEEPITFKSTPVDLSVVERAQGNKADDVSSHDSIQKQEFNKYKTDIEERLNKIDAEHAQLMSRMQEFENKLAENKGQPTPEQFKAIMNLSETLPAEMKDSVNDRTIKFIINTPDGKAKFNEILQVLRACVAI